MTRVVTQGPRTAGIDVFPADRCKYHDEVIGRFGKTPSGGYLGWDTVVVGAAGRRWGGGKDRVVGVVDWLKGRSERDKECLGEGTV